MRDLPHPSRNKHINIVCKHVRGVIVFKTLKACSRPAASSKAWQKTVPSWRSVSSTLHLNSFKLSSYCCKRGIYSQRQPAEQAKEYANIAYISPLHLTDSQPSRRETTSSHRQPQIAFSRQHPETSRLSSVLALKKRSFGAENYLFRQGPSCFCVC